MNGNDEQGEEEVSDDSLRQMLRLFSLMYPEFRPAEQATRAGGNEGDNSSAVHLPLCGICTSALGSNAQTGHGIGQVAAHPFSGGDFGSHQFQAHERVALADPFHLPTGGEGLTGFHGRGYGSVDLLSSPSFPCNSLSQFLQSSSQTESLQQNPDHNLLLNRPEVGMLGHHSYTSPQALFVMPFHTEPGYRQVPFLHDDASTMPRASAQPIMPEPMRNSLALPDGSQTFPGLWAATEMELLRSSNPSFNSAPAVEQSNSFLMGQRTLASTPSVPVDNSQPRASEEANTFRFTSLGPTQERTMASRLAIGSALGHDALMESYARLPASATFASLPPDHQAAPSHEERKGMPPQAMSDATRSSRDPNLEQKLSSSMRFELTKNEWKTPAETLLALKVLGTTLRSRADPYFDASKLNDPEIPPSSRGGVSELFPDRLYRMLSELEAQEKADVAGWLPHHRAFLVHKPDVFVREVLPAYFKGQSKWSSFSRQLNLYGFQRVVSG
jgi:hypothetical protein